MLYFEAMAARLPIVVTDIGGVADLIKDVRAGVPIHELTYFRETLDYGRGDFANAERIGDSTISVPLYASLSFADVDRVCDLLRGILSRRSSQRSGAPQAGVSVNGT